MTDIRIEPFSAPFDLSFTPPGSKSLTNRALVLAALANGPSELTNVLFADDTRIMFDCLRKLGISLQVDEASNTVRVEGASGKIPASGAELFCGNSGTTIRFLTAMCALGHGDFVLDGIPRMRQRPIRELCDLLHNLAVRFEYLGEAGFRAASRRNSSPRCSRSRRTHAMKCAFILIPTKRAGRMLR
jgi:3-phosphoshikimate 1-carboxyvinyltransferase